MRTLVGVLALALVTLLTASGIATADTNDWMAKKYGIELSLGGSFIAMQDVNDYIPDPAYLGTPDKINLGTQFGFGFTYRSMRNFGWQFGYSRFAAGIPAIMEQKYRDETYFPGVSNLSWVEQTISGWELYSLATWYWPWKNKELSIAVGPSIFGANIDRSISNYRTAGSGANPAGSFSNAGGSSLGFVLAGGVEIPIKHDTFLNLSVGGRLGNVGKITYEDASGVEQTVYKNTGSNAEFGVDFSGAYLKATIRTYFKPSSDWRNPKK